MTYSVNDWPELEDNIPVDSGIYLAFSSDGVHWSGQRQILPIHSLRFPDYEVATYPSIIWDDSEGQSGEGWLTYYYSPDWGVSGDHIAQSLVGHRITLNAPVLTPVNSALLAYEGFAYSQDLLAGQDSAESVGFQGTWVNRFGEANVGPDSLLYPGHYHTGNHAQQGLNSRTRRRFDLDLSGPWASYLEMRQVTEAGIASTRPLIGAAQTRLYVSFLQEASVNEGFYAFEIQRGDYSTQELDNNRVLFVGFNTDLVLCWVRLQWPRLPFPGDPQ